MTREYPSPRYFRQGAAANDVGGAGRLSKVRVRTFELRLIGLVLAASWTVAAAYVLIGYRPGGPIDIAVGIAAMLVLAAACLLVLVPSIADVSGQLGGRGAQTLLPSVEAAYPWVLALVGTSLFTGFGIARRRLGEAAMRRRRLVRGIMLATVLAAGSGLAFAAVALGNELALRDRTASSSRFGPTDPLREPPDCDGAMGIGAVARIGAHFEGSLDGR